MKLSRRASLMSALGFALSCAAIGVALLVRPDQPAQGGAAPRGAPPDSTAECATTEADPFCYDAAAPLQVRELSEREAEGVVTTDLTYRSPRGGVVPAFVVAPDQKGRFAGLILQHGLPGSRRDLLAASQELARLGAVVLLIDAPFARRPGEPVHFDRRDRAEQLQLIVDLRRGVDLLRRRDDVDAARVGYVGISYGGAMGGLLAGVEPRIAAFVLAVGDGGLLEHFGENGRPLPGVPGLTAVRWRRWVEALRGIEPLVYVGRATAPVLFQSARFDEAVSSSDARRFQRAGPDRKKILWYDSGHFLPDQAVCDNVRWLAAHIGIATDHPTCG